MSYKHIYHVWYFVVLATSQCCRVCGGGNMTQASLHKTYDTYVHIFVTWLRQVSMTHLIHMCISLSFIRRDLDFGGGNILLTSTGGLQFHWYACASGSRRTHGKDIDICMVCVKQSCPSLVTWVSDVIHMHAWYKRSSIKSRVWVSDCANINV